MSLNPIVLDIESSGLDKLNCGVWQIGALDFNTGETFFEEAKIDEGDVVEEGALKVIGKTEEELRDSSKQDQKLLISNFFSWMSKRPLKNLLCQNPQFDQVMLEMKGKKYGLSIPFYFRSFDLHSVAQTVHQKLNGEFLIKGDKSQMSLGEILNFCGMEDNRTEVKGNEIVKEGLPHNALTDAKLTAECFSRLLYGKGLFPEFSQYKIPEYLEAKQ